MKLKLSLLVALVVVAGGVTPALAEDSKEVSKWTGSVPPSSIPKRMVGFALGTILGTPVALVRCTKRELRKQTQEAMNLGGVPKPLGYVTAAAFGIPSGLLCGLWYGTFDGGVDGFMNSEQTPFNKATYSLDKLQY